MESDSNSQNHTDGTRFGRLFESELTWESRSIQGRLVLQQEIARQRSQIRPRCVDILQTYLSQGNLKLVLNKLINHARSEAIECFVRETCNDIAAEWDDAKWMERYVESQPALFDWLEEGDLDLRGDGFPDRELLRAIEVRDRARELARLAEGAQSVKQSID